MIDYSEKRQEVADRLNTPVTTYVDDHLELHLLVLE